jgi:hypothetical protein
MKKFLILSWKVLVALFAIIGLVFTVVYFGMRIGVFNVRGSIVERNTFFSLGAKKPIEVAPTPCVDEQTACDWNETPEWQAIKGGLTKDAEMILRVSSETGVDARIIAAVVVPEQTRFFTANRDVFKRYFEPLKILGSLTQFSLGISGIKQTTANAIEAYAADPTSEFYPGDGMAALIAYESGANHDAELYNRLTDPKDHYYQYLYTALFVKEIQEQWLRAGFDVSKQPEVIVTLFNIGFQASHPNPMPQVAGAPITTGGTVYTYGKLGSTFYHSGELSDIFPH